MIAISLTHILQTPKGANKVLKVPRASKWESADEIAKSLEFILN